MSDDIQAMEEVAAPVEQEVEQVETPGEVTEQPEEPAEPVKKEDEDAPIPKGVQKRIDRAIRRQYEAEAEAMVLREQIAQVQRQPPPQQQIEVAPTPDQFPGGEYDPEYLRAIAKHEAKAEIQQQLQHHARLAEQERAQAAQRQTAESWNQKVSKATAELPDFDEVVGRINLNELPPHIGATLAESDLGPQVAYYLVNHPDEAVEIAGKQPLAAIRALMRIEDKLLAAKPVKKATETPAPINPVGSKAKSVKAPEDMPWEEFKAWRRKQIAQRR